MILLTGATGFLGGAILARFIELGLADSLLLLVRAPSAEEGATRVRDNLAGFGLPAETLAKAIDPARIILGDLQGVDAFAADPRLESVTRVVNSAALATFSNNPNLWPINVDGTLAFARRMAKVPGLERFLHVGTAMCCGTGLESPIVESWDHGRPDNQLVPYTESKLEAERRMRAELPDLPLVVARPSIIIGHSQLGCAPSGSIYWIFRVARALERYTCALSDRVDVISVDDAAKALVDLALKPTLAHDLYHVSAGLGAVSTFGEIEQGMAAGLGEESIAPRYQQVSHRQLNALGATIEERIGACNRRLMMRAIRLYGAFAELDYVFDNQRLLAEGIALPRPFADYVRVCATSTANIPIPEQMAWDFK